MKKSKDDFVHLHVHSDASTLDGCGKIPNYVKKAKNMNQNAIALTEHGTMRSYYAQLLECQEHDMKPVYGIEAYVSNDMRRKGLTEEEKREITIGLKKSEHKKVIRYYEDREGIRDRWHLTIWAKNKTGMKNLFKLSSKAWIDGFYYKPRIDVNELIKHKEGLVVATGCCSSVVYEHAVSGRHRKAHEVSDRLYEEFGEDLWIEIMPHKLRDQIRANEFALKLIDRWDGKVRPLATQDAHYVEPSDWEAHEVMLCIGTNNMMSNPDRFRFGNGELYLKSRQEMYRDFMKNHDYLGKKLIKESLDNTLVFTNKIEDDIVEIDRFACYMPPSKIPKEYGGEFEYIKGLCVAGWSWRNIPDRALAYSVKSRISYEEAIYIYKTRLKKELKVIQRQKFVGYFLLIRDLVQWARKRDIMCGPGRGSAAGSIVSFLLGITSVDPIEHDLLFERFLNVNRVDYPDIDLDFEDVKRKEIIEHLRQKYGENHTCQIATVGKLSGKSCVKDTARVLGVPYAEVNAITPSIIDRRSGDNRAAMTVEDSFRNFKVCRDFDKKYPDVLKHARIIEGMGKTLGIHAAGVVTSPIPLDEIIPLEVRKHDGEDVVVSAIDKNGVQAMGLLKLDALGLRTLTVLKDALREIKNRIGEDIDLENLDLNIPNVLQGFTEHDYVGIFQYDSPGSDKICSGITFETFNDIAVMTALNRPGTSRSGLATQYTDRKKNSVSIKNIGMHPKMMEITANTLGVMVYQEQVQKIFSEIAGYSLSEADEIRKKIAKSVGDEAIGKERENFIAGAKRSSGMSEEEASKIIDTITYFGSYSFNRAHAVSYAVIAYWSMYIKRNYPLEFFWALLKNETQTIRIQQYAKDAKKHNIGILLPDVSLSSKEFSIEHEKNEIRCSLIDIKQVGDAAADSIIEHQPYDDFFDFINKVDRRKVHKGVIKALARSGALDKYIPNVKWFIENIEIFWRQISKKTTRELFNDSKKFPDYAVEERQLIASCVNPIAFGKHPIDLYSDFIKESVKIKTVMVSDDNFWSDYDNEGVYIVGIIVGKKYNQIGDFHSGELPSEIERDRMFWGKRYANVNVEDTNCEQYRIKFDIDVFDDMCRIIDSDVGTPVIIYATPNSKHESLRAHFAVNLEELRIKIKNNTELDVWERIITGNHPANRNWKARSKLKSKQLTLYRNTNKLFFNGKSKRFTGVVTNVRLKYDKNGNLMAFFGLIDASNNFINCIAFSSAWTTLTSRVIKAGKLIIIELNRKKDMRDNLKWQYFFDGGKIHCFKNHL